MALGDIETFDTMDAMFERMAAIGREREARVQPWQERLQPGDHYCSLYELQDGGLLPVYGEILQPDNDPEDEPLGPHARLVRAYSAWEPDGELGITHVADMGIPLEPEQFAALKAAGWPETPAEYRACVIAARWPKRGPAGDPTALV